MSKTHPLFYQSRSGHIRIGYGTASTTLTRQQIDELRIDVYSLEAFDYDDFLKAYSTPNNSVHADAGDSVVSTSSLQASAESTSQSDSAPTQRG